MAPRNFSSALKQWDAFFKEIAPDSRALRVEVARWLKVAEEDLIPVRQHPTEYRSRSVAEALHHNGVYKEFRLDGLYSTRAFPAFGYEYQSTYNNGVPLRTLMYEVAIREVMISLPEEGGVQFVILYSGRGLSKERAKNYHGKRIGFFTSARFIDLNRLDRKALIKSDVSSHVLALAREDADINLFLAAIDRINGEVRSPEERDRLKGAVTAATVGKKEVFELLKELTMDDAGIQKYLNALAGDAAHQETKDIMLMWVSGIRNAPFDLSGLVENWEMVDLRSLGTKISQAISSNDWRELGEHAKHFGPSPGG